MTQVDNGADKPERPVAERVALFALIIVVALVAGYYLAQALVPTPKIGVINIDTQITGLSAEGTAREIAYARDADDIKGVVLVVNSPGGSAYAGHDIYFQIRKLRSEKPVVASIDGLAASAAYQIAVAANEIYAKPASFIGSIGAFIGLPSPETLSEQIITTGPFKATAFSTTDLVQKLDLVHADFRDSVVAERSAAPNPLKLAPDEVATGEIWVGIEAKEYGLIDGLGSSLEAIERAAQLANIQKYEIVNVRDEYLASLDDEAQAKVLELYEKMAAEPEFDLPSQEKNSWPTLYQLYIPLE